MSRNRNRTPGQGRLKGLLIYLAAVIAVVIVHAYALHNDSTAAEQDRAADHPAKSV